MRRAGWVVLVALTAACGLFAGDSVADDQKGTEVDFDGMRSRAPAEWKEEGAKGPLRYMQFKLPRVKGDERDAEVVIFKGIGGSAKQNIDRWKGQFEAPEGKKLDDVAKVKEFKVGKAEVTYLDIYGTYLDKFPPFAPNAKTVKRPHYHMLAAHFEGPKNPYHIKLIGPEKTVEHYRKGFDEWLKNFK